MGCDIHMYVEYRDRSPANELAARWRDFGTRINPGRNYHLFERMAGVRGEESNAVVAPRGFPADASYAANEDNWTWIAYGKTREQCHEREVDEETAKQWAAYREPGQAYRGEVKVQTVTSTRLTDEGYVTTTEARDAQHDGKPRWVAVPDWHSHSWLATEEYATALATAHYATPHEEPEYHAVLAAMRSLEASGYESRVVFWFDN